MEAEVGQNIEVMIEGGGGGGSGLMAKAQVGAYIGKLKCSLN